MSATSAKKKLIRLFLLPGGLLLGAMFPPAGAAQAPTSSEQPTGAPSVSAPATDAAGCVLSGHTYTCRFGAFHHVFHHAKTIAIEASPRDRAALAELSGLVTALDRTVAPAGQGDLIFAVLPVDHGGVTIGPGDLDMATLRIYGKNPEGGHGELLWAETYRGPGDRPWPQAVHALLAQFQYRMVHWRK